MVAQWPVLLVRCESERIYPASCGGGDSREQPTTKGSMNKDTRVIWRPVKEGGQVKSPGGSGVTISDADGETVEVSVETESSGDGRTVTFDPPKKALMKVADLIAQ